MVRVSETLTKKGHKKMPSKEVQINNTIVFSECQEKNTPQFYEELQKSHKKNKKQLHQLALSNDQVEKAGRIISCTNFLTYELINQEFIRLKRINLCRERLCLNCQLVNSRKLIKQLFWSIPRLTIKNDERLYFLTLTTNNCSADELKDLIQYMCKRQVAFFRHYGITDYFRSVEITYNQEEQTYHPHLHIIFLVSKYSKFPFYNPAQGIYGANQLQKEWHEWLTHTNNGYKMATVYEIKDTKTIFELCKYITKVKDLENFEVLKVLNEQLKGLRLKTPVGQFKTLAKAYKQECTSIKLQELQFLEEAEIQLINMLYNPKKKKYEVKSIADKNIIYRM